ncbi:MAG: excinuclease ABC subunit UvrC [Rhodospirillales bacterium]|nr:excinuclease ABC subunit UvrC [Rhodospirillales bacterium]
MQKQPINDDVVELAENASHNKGADAIKVRLPGLPTSPGVYRMLNDEGDVLYVGKAKNIRKRVTSYTKPERQSLRIRRMIAQTVKLEIVKTETEAEALLLESDLIKRYAPRYNILLRDDKSFPMILITGDHDYPQIVKYRGARSRSGQYFGPFASVWAVNDTLALLQRAFLLRTCSDAVFANRTRPCLLYQIKRCCGPCVQRISKDAYDNLVSEAREFLTGDSQKIQRKLAENMQASSDALEFEMAAQYRDRIQALSRVQSKHEALSAGLDEADVIALYHNSGQTCVEVFFYRGSRSYGNRAYFPSHAKEDTAEEIIEAFVGQFYARTLPARLILTSHKLPNHDLVEEALKVRGGHKVEIRMPTRGEKKRVIDNAVDNARDALARRMSESASQRKLLEGLADALSLDGLPERIEVYDNSHVSGTNAIGAMIVVGSEGFMKSAYRKFNIRRAGTDAASAGDDYDMMREVLERRFSRPIKEDPDRTKGQWPDLVLVDGGKGQLSAALGVFEQLGIEDLALAAIAKGPDRNAGREKIFLPGKAEAINLGHKDPVLYFLQRIRDEAHRFAIGTHRAKRGKQITRSILDEVPGIGAKRKKALLHHFGAAQSVATAGIKDLETVEGINRAIAKKIYDWFHPED